MNIIILKNHRDNRDTIIYNNYILNGINFGSLSKNNTIKDKLNEFKMTDSQWKQVYDAMEKGKGDTDTSDDLPRFAVEYCRENGTDPLMRQIVIDAKNPKWAYSYALFVSDDEDMREIVLNSKNPEIASFWCENKGNDPDMRQVILESKDLLSIWRYCTTVSNDDDMRQVILDSGHSGWANMYCLTVSNDKEMQKLAELSD